MAREFYTWPHTARGIVEESLREFVGDGEGEDYEVLTTFINEVQAEALRDAADEYEARLPDGTGNGRAYNSYTVAAMLRARADRIERGADRG